jgi:hypothetical protein
MRRSLIPALWLPLALIAALLGIAVFGPAPANSSGFSPPQSTVVVCQSAVQQVLTGTASETTLATCTIPANLIGKNGQVVIEALFATPDNTANAKTGKLKFGGTTLVSASFASNVSANFRSRVGNRNATNSQVGLTSSSGFGSSGSAVATASVDTTAAVTVLITGTLATTTETIRLESYQVVVYPKN